MIPSLHPDSPAAKRLVEAEERIDRAALAIAQTYLEAAYGTRSRAMAAKLLVPSAADFRAELAAIPDAAYSFARALETARNKPS